MADHVDKVNVNDALHSENTFSFKKEECQEDNFIEDNVYTSDTITMLDNAEQQGHIDKVKQYEVSPSLDKVKTELSSFEVIKVECDNFRLKKGISTDNVKIEFDNGPLYCEHCQAYYESYCIECGMLVHILNKDASNNADSRVLSDIPNDILEIQDCFGQVGIYALRIIPAGVKFGPFTGLTATECPWEIKGEKFVLDKEKSKYLNWMQHINPTRNISEQNLVVCQCEDNLYYQSTCQIQVGDELLVYFGEEYGDSPNKIDGMDFNTTTNHIIKDVFACTFCSLGFSFKSHLTKHKSICLRDAAETFSIKELVQCQFCKIYLGAQEYYDHHMTFCCKRHDRKLILLTLENHTNNQHCKMNIYQCEICNRRFKTEESLRLHDENTHVFVDIKEDEGHSTNTHVKVEQSDLQCQKKIFKCPQCGFQTKYKYYLGIHIKSKHLKEFGHKCDECEFRTNHKNNLEKHMKSTHLKEFDFKCDSCEFRTNNKWNLERHIESQHLKTRIKPKHLKELDYICDSCEYRTNAKRKLKYHIKVKHLKEFDYKCDSCEYSTVKKGNLERHIKTTHLKEFNYKCDSCEYRANSEHYLERHIKTTHLKEFDYKCDSCDYRTNHKHYLKEHIKTIHLKEFDYKCDSCEFRTNGKNKLKYHIKTKHLKEFDYKCDKCDLKTNLKNDLEIHIKTKHLKEFNFKCDSCEFRSNRKSDLQNHIKTKHLKEFNYKCDSCEFETNRKHNLEKHMKTKHLKEFDYKCDRCEFRTNYKYDYDLHIKMKKNHLKESGHVNLEQTRNTI